MLALLTGTLLLLARALKLAFSPISSQRTG